MFDRSRAHSVMLVGEPDWWKHTHRWKSKQRVVQTVYRGRRGVVRIDDAEIVEGGRSCCRICVSTPKARPSLGGKEQRGTSHVGSGRVSDAALLPEEGSSAWGSGEKEKGMSSTYQDTEVGLRMLENSERR